MKRRADPDRETRAFPVGDQAGMTLRDWFAGHALVGLVQTKFGNEASLDIIATEAYLQADAMMTERYL